MDASHYIISDLHLGNEYCFHANFLSWLDTLPADAALILNGDIVDDPDEQLSTEHRQVVERLVAESRKRTVVWVRGNHDRHFELADAGQIQFEKQWEVGRQLLVVHGDHLDDLMPRHNLFRALFKVIHRCLIVAGFPDVHVARYAKKWGFLYRVLNDHVAHKALLAAERLGFETVTCGHTHAAMELHRNGRRYLNTGAWTEEPHHYLSVAGNQIELNLFRNGTPES